MLAYQRVTSSIPTHTNSQLLLVSSMDNAIRILLCPLMLVVNIDDGCTETCLICKEL
jgi:hypothetical protein